jgi:mono/diheme cytochrome c family protein
MAKLIISMGAIFVGGLLFGTLGADSNPEVTKGPARLIDAIDGASLYKAYCAACHGSDATGQGPMAKALKVPPPDLTRIAERNGGMFPMARVESIIAGEEPLTSGQPSRRP